MKNPLQVEAVVKKKLRNLGQEHYGEDYNE